MSFTLSQPPLASWAEWSVLATNFAAEGLYCYKIQGTMGRGEEQGEREGKRGKLLNYKMENKNFLKSVVWVQRLHCVYRMRSYAVSAWSMCKFL